MHCSLAACVHILVLNWNHNLIELTLRHSQSHENSPGVLLGLAFQKKKRTTLKWTWITIGMVEWSCHQSLRKGFEEETLQTIPPASPGPADIDSASDSSQVVSLPSHPLLLASAVRYARRRLVTSQTRHFNYLCPAFVTECLVTGKKSRATFSTNQKRNENPFVCASIFDWFIRLSTHVVFYFFHIRLMYWLFTICLMVQVERQDRWRTFSKSSDYMATAFQRSRWLFSENDCSGGVQY